MQLLDLPTCLRLSALQPRLPEPRLTVRRLTVMPSPRIRRQDCTKRVGSISQEREPTPMRSHQNFIKISYIPDAVRRRLVAAMEHLVDGWRGD